MYSDILRQQLAKTDKPCRCETFMAVWNAGATCKTWVLSKNDQLREEMCLGSGEVSAVDLAGKVGVWAQSNLSRPDVAVWIATSSASLFPISLFRCPATAVSRLLGSFLIVGFGLSRQRLVCVTVPRPAFFSMHRTNYPIHSVSCPSFYFWRFPQIVNILILAPPKPCLASDSATQPKQKFR